MTKGEYIKSALMSYTDNEQLADMLRLAYYMGATAAARRVCDEHTAWLARMRAAADKRKRAADLRAQINSIGNT